MKARRVTLPGLASPVLFHLHSDADRYISDEIEQLGVWEPFETELVRRLLRPGALFLDAGANLGWYSVLAALWGARVLAFEPMSKNLDLLRANVAENGVGDRVEIIDAALGASVGHVPLQLSADNQGDHRLSAHPGGPVEHVDVTTIDEVCGAEVPQFVKIDTQGSEARILRGGSRALAARNAADTTFIVEYWPYGLADCGTSAEELIGMLASYAPRTHALFEIRFTHELLRPVALADLAAMAADGDLSPEAGGHTNLLLVPHAEVARVADLVEPDDSTAARTFDISAHEWSAGSQNGEDGIVSELAKLTGCPRTMIEFGAGDGSECNSRHPRAEGWRVAAFDGDPGDSEWVVKQFLTAENVQDVVRSSELADDLGVLSVDLDGNDYWVLRQVLELCLPHVIVVEYNATLGPVQALAVRYRAQRRWDHTNYFGASLAAFALLGAHHGYSFVGCESRGANAFFVRDDALERARLRATSVADGYRPPRYGRANALGVPTGHDATGRRFVDVSDQELADRAYRAYTGNRLTRPLRIVGYELASADWWRHGRTWFKNASHRLRGLPVK